jgi:hypothetical protein
MRKRNAVTFLLEAALQEKTDIKIVVEWGGRNMKRGYIIERLPGAEIFIKLDPDYFDEEIEIVEVWQKLSSWVDTYANHNRIIDGRYRQTSLTEYLDEEER